MKKNIWLVHFPRSAAAWFWFPREHKNAQVNMQISHIKLEDWYLGTMC